MHDAQATHQVEAALQSAERSQRAVEQALLAGHADLLEAAAADLQRSASALSDAVLAVNGAIQLRAPLGQRVVAVARGMVMYREACLRRGALVQRTLQSILPDSGNSTYGSTGPYARAARQSGAFKLLSA
jgi:acyl-CoA reductase-like NAD-dependent aldehyde dehydrogenase